MRSVRICRPAVESRIQGIDLVNLFIGQLRQHGQVDLAADGDGREIGLVFQLRQLQPIGLGIGYELAQRQQFWHVGAGLPGQFQMPEIGWLARILVAADGSTNVAFARVVPGDRQLPVTVKFLVQKLQIVQCSSCRVDDVPPAVVPPVLTDAKPARGSRDKLPQSGGPAVRVCKGIVGALNDRQQGEVRRHAPLVYLVHDEPDIAR